MKEERRILGMLCLLYANALILALPSKGPTSKTRVQKPLDSIGPSLVASGKKSLVQPSTGDSKTFYNIDR